MTYHMDLIGQSFLGVGWFIQIASRDKNTRKDIDSPRLWSSESGRPHAEQIKEHRVGMFAYFDNIE